MKTRYAIAPIVMLAILAAFSASASAQWDIQTVDSAGFVGVGTETSIALDSNGYLERVIT